MTDRKVLLIEDNPGDARIMREMLSEAKIDTFNITHVDHLSKGLERLNNSEFDIVILDLGLPDSRGTDTFTKIASQFPRTPVIILTGSEDEEQAIAAVRKGAQDYIVKCQVNSQLIVRSMVYAIERKRMEKMREQFLSHVTHELRTPLGPLKVYLDYVVAGKLGPVPEKLRSGLQVMKRSVDRLHGLTNELLDLRRIHAGTFQVNLESMNFRKILEESIKEIQAQTDQKKQRVHLEVAEGPLPAHGDPTRLGQVLMNLLGNAVKFTPEEGAITVKVDDDGDTIKCKISDTGIGIRKEDLPKVFEPFSNINKPGNIQTLGLGLSITKGIVEAHGGKIWAESDGEGKGATFTFTIPKLKGGS